MCKLPKNPKKPKNHEHQGTAIISIKLLKAGTFDDKYYMLECIDIDIRSQ